MGAPHIDADESVAALSQLVAGAHNDMGFLFNSFGQLFLGFPQRPEIDPGEICSVRLIERQLWQSLTKRFLEDLIVSLDVLHQLFQPDVALVVRGLRCLYAHYVLAVEQVGLVNGRHIAGVQLRILRESIGKAQSGRVVCFAGGKQGDRILRYFRRQRCDGDVFLFVEHQPAVHIVRNDHNIVLPADARHALQLFPVPRASHRVMRIAKAEDLCFRGKALFQIFKIHGIAPAIRLERIHNGNAAVVPDDAVENKVNGRLDDNLIPRFCKGVQDRPEGSVYPHAERNRFSGIHLPAVIPVQPVFNGAVKAVIHVWIPQMSPVGNGADGVQNRLRRTEVHIGSTGAQQFRIPGTLLLRRPFHAADPAAVQFR